MFLLNQQTVPTGGKPAVYLGFTDESDLALCGTKKVGFFKNVILVIGVTSDIYIYIIDI